MAVVYPNLFRLGYGCDPQTAAVAPPTLSYATPQSWTYGAAISTLSPTTTGATSFAVQSGALPTGVSLNTSTGAITGTPTAWAASGSVTIRATGAGGTADSTINWTMVWAAGSVANLVGWYDGSDLSSLFQDSARTVPVAADADPIAAMSDKSGTGNHITRNVTGNRFTYKAAIQNSRAVARGDGVDDYLSCTLGAAPTIRHFFLVLVPREVANKGGFAVGSNASLLKFRSNGSVWVRGLDGSQAQTAAGVYASGTAILLTAKIDAAGSASLRVNGVDAASYTFAAGTMGTVMGTVDAAISEHFACDLCEWREFQGRALTAPEIAAVEASLNSKWAVY